MDHGDRETELMVDGIKVIMYYVFPRSKWQKGRSTLPPPPFFQPGVGALEVSEIDPLHQARIVDSSEIQHSGKTVSRRARRFLVPQYIRPFRYRIL
jgi:hypothetical protein